MKDNIKTASLVVFIISAAVLFAYCLIAFCVAIGSATKQATFCERENGYIDAAHTGNRWQPDPLALGTTGECVEPAR